MPIALRQTGATVVAARQHRCLATARAKNPTYKIPGVFRSQGSTVFKTPVVVFRHQAQGEMGKAGIVDGGQIASSYAADTLNRPHPRTLQPTRMDLPIERRGCQWDSAPVQWITWAGAILCIPCNPLRRAGVEAGYVRGIGQIRLSGAEREMGKPNVGYRFFEDDTIRNRWQDLALPPTS